MRYLTRVSSTSVVVMALAFASSARAQPAPSFDHLQCFEIRDPMPRDDGATVDLVPEHGAPFQVAAGCKVRFPAKYFCTDVSKENVQPSPPGTGGGSSLGEYFCYRLSCPRATAPARGSTIAVGDQFGERVITLAKRSPLLCVPAARSFPPTATPSVTPMPTDTPTPAIAPCAQVFNFPFCAGGCPPSQICVAVPDTFGNLCGCRPASAACEIGDSPTCGGACRFLDAVCVSDGESCTCKRSPCDQASAPACDGVCLGGGTCIANTASDGCVCAD